MSELRLHDLRVGFGEGREQRVAVDGLSLTVPAGQTYALVGESGCGKSVSALSILRLLPPGGRLLGGDVSLDGESLPARTEAQMRNLRGGRIGMIFQEPATSLNPVLTIGQQIVEVLQRHRGMTGAAARSEAVALLTAVGLSDPARRCDEYPFQLSGGMKQRAMIAMALAGNPDLLLADEPTTALDVTVQAQILALLRELQAARRMSMLLITHDLGVVAQMAHRVGVMYAGQLVEEGPIDTFFARPQHPYTRGLFAALPTAAQRDRALLAIPGQVPAPGAMPAGCRFAPRCPHAWERCRTEAPEWQAAGDGQWARCHLLASPERSAAIAPVNAPVNAAAGGPAAASESPVLRAQALQVHFPIRRGILMREVGAVRAVDGVDLAVPRGRTLALVGESGCGKTTVGKALMQLVRPTGGAVWLGGEPLRRADSRGLSALRRKVQMVFQDPFASLNPKRSVGEILVEGLHALQVGAPAERAGMIAALVEAVGLPADAVHRYPHEFSGGQRQRIAIARALAVQPEVLVCDEPTSALDVSVQAQILNLLRKLQQDLGLAYLFITHNFAVVEFMAHEVAVMYLGRIVERGPAADVLRRPRHPYTTALLAAVPRPDPTQARQDVRVVGEAPSPARPPSGCHFHPRCPQAGPRCRADYPEETQITDGHAVRCHLHTPGGVGA